MKVFFCPYFQNPYQCELAAALTHQGVEVLKAPTKRIFSLTRATLRQGKPDLIHLHWTHPLCLSKSLFKTLIKTATFLSEVILLKLAGIRLVWTVHNLHNHENVHLLIEKMCHILLARLGDALIVHCEYARKQVIEYYNLNPQRNSVHVIPHGNYIDSYPNNISRRKARRELGLNDKFVFLFFGQLRPYKGLDLLIEAFKQLPQDTVELVIAGRALDPDYATLIHDSTKDDPRIITYLRYIDDDTVQHFFQAADIVVLPFKSIFTSGSLLLALSFGKPVVVSELGCIRDFPTSPGLITFTPVTPSRLERALIESTHLDLIKASKANRELARRYDWHSIGKKTSNIYFDVVK